MRKVGLMGRVAIAAVLATAFSFSVQAQVSLKQPCAQVGYTLPKTRPPAIFLGMSIDFEQRIAEAFPIGSPESQLILWLDSRGFGEIYAEDGDSAFIDSQEEYSRLFSRMEDNLTINLRRLTVWAPIGQSHFSVAWNSDECGRLTEIFADTELFQFDMP